MLSTRVVILGVEILCAPAQQQLAKKASAEDVLIAGLHKHS
ncbi:MAG: hypothetical protein AAF810_10500 [Cyanobacteria bacterium P01_D01_bin.36]